MINFIDETGKQHSAIVECKKTKGVNGEKSLTGTIYTNDEILEGIGRGWRLQFEDENYCLTYVNPIDEGTRIVVEFDAVHEFFFDMSKSVVYQELNGSNTADAYLKFIFNGSGYEYRLEVTIPAFEKESFGMKNRLDLFKDFISSTGVEFSVNGKIVRILEKVGSNLSTIVKKGFNLNELKIEKDAGSFITYIKGFGAYNDSEDPSKGRLEVEYLSPLADIYGKLEGDPIVDERYTKSDSLLTRLKNEVESSYGISVDIDMEDLTKAGYEYDQPHEGDYIMAINKDLGFEQKVRIMSYTTSYDTEGSILDHEVSCGSDNIIKQSAKSESNFQKNVQAGLENAVNTANQAWISADGKNKVFTGTDEPVATNKGDIWYQVDGEKTIMKFWNGYEWQAFIDPKAVQQAADEAKALGEEAKQAGEEAKQAGAAAQVSADEAKALGEEAKQAGEDAKVLGNQALEAGQNAVDKAITADNNATTALTNANSAVEKATQASQKADNSATTANEAKTQATNAITNANTALTNANKAISDAGKLSEDVSALDTIANQAKSNADTALTNASNAINQVTQLNSDLEDTNGQVSTLTDNLNGFKQTVYTKTQTDTKIATVQSDVNGFKTSVSNTYATKSEIQGIKAGVRNYICEVAWTTSGGLGANGEIVANAGRRISGYIEINANADYFIQVFEVATLYNLQIAFYDSSQKFISLITVTDASTKGKTPANAASMRISTPYRAQYGGRYKFEFGTVGTDWTQAPEDTQFIYTNLQTQVDQTANAVSNKADKTTVYQISGRVDTAEGNITTMAGQIKLKANQSTVDTITNRVSATEASLSLQDGKIATLTTKTNGLDTSLASLNQDYNGFKTDVYTKSQTDTKVSTVQQSVDQFKTTVSNTYATKRALSDYVDSQNWQVLTTGQDLNVMTTSGKFFVQSGNNTNYPARPNRWFYLTVDSVNGRIKQDYQDDFDVKERYFRTSNDNGKTWQNWQRVANGEDITTQQTSIDQNAKQIALKADQTTVNAITGRVSTAEGKITTMAGQIDLKANKTDVDTLTGRVSATESSLKLQDGKITALTSKTDGQTTQIGDLQSSYSGLSSTVATVQTNVQNIDKTINWQKLTTGQNLNNMTTTGKYFVAAGGNANAPENSNRWFYLSVDNTSGRIKQDYQDDYDITERYFRMSNNNGSTWQNWQRVVNVTEFSSLTQTISSIQGTVANKAEQSQVTQLAGQITSVVGGLNSPNLLKNTEFIDKSSWTFTDNSLWSIGSNQYDSYNGSNALRFFRTGLTSDSWTDAYSEYISVEEGQIVSASGIVYSTGSASWNPDRTLNLSIDFYSAVGSSRLSTFPVFFDLSNPYGKQTLKIENVKTPSGAKYARLSLHISRNGNIMLAHPQFVKSSFVGQYTPSTASQSQITQLSDRMNFRITNSDGSITQIDLANKVISLSGEQVNITGNTYIANGVIKTAAIADLAVSTAKIANLAVSDGKIANLAVTNAKIASLAVDEGKIANLAVTNAKIGSLAVSEGKIADLAVTNAKIANLAVSTAKIADLAVTNAKIGSISADKINVGTLNAANVNIINLNANNITTGTITGIDIKASTFYGTSVEGNMQLNGNDLRFNTSTNSFKIDYSGITNINNDFGTRNIRFVEEGIAITAGSENQGIRKNSGYFAYGKETYLWLVSEGNQFQILNNPDWTYFNTDKPLLINSKQYTSIYSDLLLNGKELKGASNVVTSSGVGSWKVTSLEIKDFSTASPYLQVASGNTVFGVSMWSSDRNLKKNISVQKESALSVIDQLKIKQFDWKEGGKHVDFGLIAQEVETVLPDAVFSVTQPSGEQRRQLKSEAFVPLLLKSIQELKQEIETLKAKVA